MAMLGYPFFLFGSADTYENDCGTAFINHLYDFRTFVGLFSKP